MPRTNGGIIGKRNVTSFGKDTVHNKTSSGTITTQPATTLANILVVAGGGGGGGINPSGVAAAGAGAGGARLKQISICGNTPYSVVVGGGGNGGAASNIPGTGYQGSNSSFAPCTPLALDATGGGGGANNYTSYGPSPAGGPVADAKIAR